MRQVVGQFQKPPVVLGSHPICKSRRWRHGGFFVVNRLSAAIALVPVRLLNAVAGAAIAKRFVAFFVLHGFVHTAPVVLFGHAFAVINPIPAAGVIAASGGNAGIATATAAQALGVRSEIFVPTVISPAKRDKLEQLGARVVVTGAVYAEAFAACQRERRCGPPRHEPAPAERRCRRSLAAGRQS